MSDGMLLEAINNPLRKKHDLNILFGNMSKNPNVEGFNQWCDPKKHQTDEDVKKLYNQHKNNYKNYGFATGHEGLADFDFDWLWVYLRAREHFGERLNSHTIKTPNDGIRVLLFTDSIKNPEKFKESLKTEVHFKKYVACYGEAKKDDDSIGKYQAVQDTEIRKDDTIAKDLIDFLSELFERYKFLSYPCIKSKLPHKKNHLTHDQRLAISNFLVHAGIPTQEAAEFFSICPDYDRSYSEYQVADTAQRIKDGRLNYPPCESLRSDFGCSIEQCKGCPRKAEFKNESGKNDGAPAAKKVPLPRLQDIELHLSSESYILKYLNYALRSNDAYFEYHFAAALSHLSMAVDRRLHIRMVQQTIYPNIWSFCLGDSTVSRKTTAAKKGEEMAAAVFGLEKFLPRAGSPEALIEILSDTPRGVIWKDEAGQTLKEMQKTYMGDIKDTFCKLYENQGDHRKLRTSQRKNQKTEFKIVDPYITVFLATVPDVFKEYTNILDVTSGWLVRFLYFTPDYEKPYMPFRPETEEDITAWAGALTSLKNIYNIIQSNDGEVRLSQEALTVFQQWQESSERKLMESKNKIEMAIFGRLVTYCLKIALLLTISENPEAREIPSRLVKDSISLIDGYFKLVAIELIEEIGLDERNNLQDKIIATIKRAGERITQRQLLKRLHRTLKDVSEAIEALEASGEIVVVQSDSRVDSCIIKLNVMDTVPSVPNVPTVPKEKGINGTVVDTSENSKDIHARDACKEQLSSYGTLVPLGTVETLGTTQEICGICENPRTPPISQESGEKSLGAHAGTDGNNHNLNDSDGGRAKITTDSPDESQKFGSPASPTDIVTQGNLPDEAAKTNLRPALERAGKQWQDMNNCHINSTNLTQFLMWFCSQYARERKPTDFQDIASRIFKITPSTLQSGDPDDKAAEPKMIKLRFLVDNIPVFVGMDGRRYGPFWKGAEAEVPAVNAMALLKRQVAVKIEDRPEGAKDDQKDIKNKEN